MTRRKAKQIDVVRLPSAVDISPGYGKEIELPDEKTAREQFFGKTLEEAEGLFRKNALHYQEALSWMGARGFQFYVRAFINYMKSEASSGDSDAVNSFVGLVGFRLEEPAVVAPIAGELRDVCVQVLEQWGRYEVDEALYGDLRSEYRTAITKLEEIVD